MMDCSEEVDELYKNGIIYQIVCNITKEVYIGSTKNKLCRRMTAHRQKGTCISKQIIERGNYTPSIIVRYPCRNRSELRWRERYYMETMECINTIPPIISREEELAKMKKWREDNADKVKTNRVNYSKDNKEARTLANKKWREDNAESCLEKSRTYRQNNKELIAATNKKWREDNAEALKLKKAEYYQKSKANLKFITCGCGGTYCDIGTYPKKQHEGTKKHLKWVADSLA